MFNAYICNNVLDTSYLDLEDRCSFMSYNHHLQNITDTTPIPASALSNYTIVLIFLTTSSSIFWKAIIKETFT